MSKLIFKDRLILLRESHGLDQSQLAKILGFRSRSSVSLWELGLRTPKLWKLQVIAEYFNVSMDYLTGNTDDPAPGKKTAPPSEEDMKKAASLAAQLSDSDTAPRSPAYQRMIAAGLTKEDIEEIAEFAISVMARKKPPA